MTYRKETRISTDRQGNPYQLKFAKQVIDFKTKEPVDAHECFAELGGKLYHISICDAHAKGDRPDGKWCRITRIQKQQNKPTSM